VCASENRRQKEISYRKEICCDVLSIYKHVVFEKTLKRDLQKTLKRDLQKTLKRDLQKTRLKAGFASVVKVFARTTGACPMILKGDLISTRHHVEFVLKWTSNDL